MAKTEQQKVKLMPTYIDREGDRVGKIVACGNLAPAVYLYLCSLQAYRPGGWKGSISQLVAAFKRNSGRTPSKPALAKALSKLEGAGIISTETAGKWTIYRIAPPVAPVRNLTGEDPHRSDQLSGRILTGISEKPHRYQGGSSPVSGRKLTDTGEVSPPSSEYEDPSPLHRGEGKDLNIRTAPPPVSGSSSALPKGPAAPAPSGLARTREPAASQESSCSTIGAPGLRVDGPHHPPDSELEPVELEFDGKIYSMNKRLQGPDDPQPAKELVGAALAPDPTPPPPKFDEEGKPLDWWRILEDKDLQAQIASLGADFSPDELDSWLRNGAGAEGLTVATTAGGLPDQWRKIVSELALEKMRETRNQ